MAKDVDKAMQVFYINLINKSHMIRSCICEDEAICRCLLIKNLEEYSFVQDVDVTITEYGLPQRLFENADIEIIFLDISFEGENVGVKVARNLRMAGNRSVIIFLTVFPDFSLEGYEAEAFRYILKPITTEKIYPVLDAVFYKWENDGGHIQIKSTGCFIYMDCGKIVTIEIKGRKRNIIYGQETIKHGKHYVIDRVRSHRSKHHSKPEIRGSHSAQ